MTARTIPAVADVLKRHLSSPKPPEALIFVDGEEFIVFESAKVAEITFRETMKDVGWREAALMVYKPLCGAYLRSKYCNRGSAQCVS